MLGAFPIGVRRCVYLEYQFVGDGFQIQRTCVGAGTEYGCAIFIWRAFGFVAPGKLGAYRTENLQRIAAIFIKPTK